MDPFKLFCEVFLRLCYSGTCSPDPIPNTANRTPEKAGFRLESTDPNLKRWAVPPEDDTKQDDTDQLLSNTNSESVTCWSCCLFGSNSTSIFQSISFPPQKKRTHVVEKHFFISSSHLDLDVKRFEKNLLPPKSGNDETILTDMFLGGETY